MLESSWFNLKDSVENNILDHQKSSMTIVRNLQNDDIPQVGELLTIGFHEFNYLNVWIYPLLKIGICQELRGRLRETQERKEVESICLVAVTISRIGKEIKQNIVGTVELSFRSEGNWRRKIKYAYIANLAVDKTYRRQGIASKLLQKCELIAKQKNFTEISLHVLAENNIGQQLYLKNGYLVKEVETDLFSLFFTSKRRLFLKKLLN